MLGLRGVRLGITIPGLFLMQARAITEAAAARVLAGGDPRPEIMVPLVSTERELALVPAALGEVVRTVLGEQGVELHIPLGPRVEISRAARTEKRAVGED